MFRWCRAQRDTSAPFRGGVMSEKRKRPGWRCWLSPARLPGLLEWTGPPLVECRALAFGSTCSHRPSRLAARRAMPRSDSTPVSRPRTRWHRFTLTRLPEPSVLAPIGTDLAGSSWGGPRSFGSSPRLRCPHPTRRRCATRRPKATGHPLPEGVERARSSRRTARRLRVSPCPSSAPAGLRLPRHPKVAVGPV